MLHQIVERPFEKDGELWQLKQDVERLGREIVLKNQSAKLNSETSHIDNDNTHKEAVLISVTEKEPKVITSLLPKKNDGGKVRSM